ncbi:MAG: hypothetical protein PQJ44_07675, partial [Sphaerochaetaceae bacterium]|nr:hypothetical protein [Sphaerochaetaceae bacterium]
LPTDKVNGNCPIGLALPRYSNQPSALGSKVFVWSLNCPNVGAVVIAVSILYRTQYKLVP